MGYDDLPLSRRNAGIFLCTYVKYLTLCGGIFVDFFGGCKKFVVLETNSVRSHAAAFATSGGIRGEWGRQTAKSHNPLEFLATRCGKL